MGTLVTFYSYKGGVGRTMTLANIAALMAAWGRKVLVVDWDLEAPGVEHFLAGRDELAPIQQRKGLIELLTQLSEGIGVSDAVWKPMLQQLRVPKVRNPISLLTAGARSHGYFRNVRKLDVKSFYEDRNGGHLIEGLRSAWRANFDFVLVDSRTGITDIGGICTIQLPDILVLVFTATDQSLQGAVDVAKKAAIERQKLPFDRSVVPALPIPSRFDTQTEQKIAQDWLSRFESALAPLYAQWLPKEIDRRKFLERTKIPYTPYYSFGEALPVVEQGTTDSAGLGYAFETVAALIANNLQHAETVISSRDELVRVARCRSRLPKTPLRELPWDSVLFIDLVGASSLKALSPEDQNEVLSHYQSVVADAAQHDAGVLAMSNEDSFLFAFPETEKALACALSVQGALAVKIPIQMGSLGHLRVRMAVHCSSEHEKREVGITPLFQTASRIAGKVQEGQILVSGDVRRRISESAELKFVPKEQLEIERTHGGPTITELFEAVQITPVVFTPEERAALFRQDPKSKSGGGFQAFLVALQNRTLQPENRLDLTISDRERIARYAHDYRGGGWQGRLRKIFGRTLGSNLGREMN